jgi:glycosyltransferase involved in cell wall biosynthesis
LVVLTRVLFRARRRGGGGRFGPRRARPLVATATGWADHVIVVSQECWHRVNLRGTPEEKLSIVLNTTSWPSPAGDMLPARSEGDGDSSFLVAHSTLVGRYGVDIAIRAFAQLAARWPQLTLRVIGDGEERPALEKLAQDLRVGDRVIFTGQLPWNETITQVKRAAVGIVSVVADGYGEVLLPTKLLEYARFGVPVACSRLAAVLPYFSGDAVTYFEPGNVEELGAALDRLLKDPALRTHQASQAQLAVRAFAWERVRHSYLAALALDDRLPKVVEGSPA